MSIIDRTAPGAKPIPADPGPCTLDHADYFVPSAEDWAGVASWDAERGEAFDQEAETPTEVLDRDHAPWWASLPESPELDGYVWEPVGPRPELAPVLDYRALVLSMAAGEMWEPTALLVAAPGDRAARSRAARMLGLPMELVRVVPLPPQS